MKYVKGEEKRRDENRKFALEECDVTANEFDRWEADEWDEACYLLDMKANSPI